MTTKDTGGPAFPTENARQTDFNSWHEEGMTLRDYFAAKAMQAWLVGINDPKIDVCAKSAYEIADAMLVERNKQWAPLPSLP